MKSTNYYPKVGTQITDLVWNESSLYGAPSLGPVKIRIKYLALQSAAIRIIYGKYVYLRFSYARKKALELL